MNEQDQKIASLQTIVNYYRHKCYDLEYQYVLYQAKVDLKLKELEEKINNGGRPIRAGTYDTTTTITDAEVKQEEKGRRGSSKK